MTPAAIPAGEGFPPGSIKERRHVLICPGISDTFGIFAGNLVELVDFRRHAEPVFFYDRAVPDDIQGAFRGNRSQFF